MTKKFHCNECEGDVDLSIVMSAPDGFLKIPQQALCRCGAQPARSAAR